MRLHAAPLVLTLVLGCGSADETRTARDEGPEKTVVTPAINLCPYFQGALVVPKTLLLGEFAIVAAFATDPDAPDAQLRYAWTATSGELSNPEGAETEYRCAEVGDQWLTLSASDELDCTTQMDIEVFCIGS